MPPSRWTGSTSLQSPGEVLGLLGPNGSGKTTCVRILSTLLRPDAGRARVAGFDVVDDAAPLRAVIGLAGQYAAVDELLTGRENLDLVGLWYHLPRRERRQRADEILERFGLTAAANRTVGTYSGGMRRRLDVGASLIGRPPVLFLDEPTTGLDPRTRNDLWQLIEELVAEGTTVLLTTQYMDEAERLAHRIVVLDLGRVIAEGTADELKDRWVETSSRPGSTTPVTSTGPSPCSPGSGRPRPMPTATTQTVAIPTRGGTPFLLQVGTRWRPPRSHSTTSASAGPPSTTSSWR